MLILQPAKKLNKRTRHHKVGLAVAGGGPLGGMYELGALRALDEALDGVDFNALDVYVGVSSGAFLAAGLANRISTAEMCRIFVTGDSTEARFNPDAFFRPAFWEYLRRAAGVPRMLMSWIGDLAANPLDYSLSDTLMRFGSLVPTGLFDNSAIEQFLHETFTRNGRTDDFRKLDRKLYVVAVELDTGRVVRFGSNDYADIPISKAIEASAALPGLYPPVEINGKHYVDGALRRTLHASVALDDGADLVIGINPLVPFDAARSHGDARGRAPSLVDGGLPAVLSQTFRTMLQSRMLASISKYEKQYGSSDVVLLEPNADDIEMFFSNVFSYANRRSVCEHAYQATLDDLRKRRAEVEPILNRRGITLNDQVLGDSERTLLSGLEKRPPRQTETTARLRRALDDLDHAMKRPRKPAAR